MRKFRLQLKNLRKSWLRLKNLRKSRLRLKNSQPYLPQKKQQNKNSYNYQFYNNQIQIIEDQEEPFEDYAFDRNGEWDEIPIFNTNDWPELCRNGKSQSPIWIDIKLIKEHDLNDIVLDYSAINTQTIMLNDGIQISLSGNFGTLQYGREVYHAHKLFFHFPSEHLIGDDKLRTDMEIQILHTSDQGQMLILSIFLLIDQTPNPFLDQLGIG